MSPVMIKENKKEVETNVTNVPQVQNAADSDEWRLVLQPVEITDQGWYSCQVSG